MAYEMSHKRAFLSSTNHRQAALVYRPYKFVVAFENDFKKGQLTEKMVNALLAGAIPIYAGAPNIVDLVNTKSFIHCRAAHLPEFVWQGKSRAEVRELLRPQVKPCLARVRKMHTNRTAYEKMRYASVLMNRDDESGHRGVFDLKRYRGMFVEAEARCRASNSTGRLYKQAVRDGAHQL